MTLPQTGQASPLRRPAALTLKQRLLRREALVSVLEEDVERGQRAIAAADVLLHLDLLRAAEFVRTVDLLL